MLKQRKSPENGDWKLGLSPQHPVGTLQETKKVSWKWRLKGYTITVLNCPLRPKQRKSPENGDWKFSMYSPQVSLSGSETKKVSWKWRLKGYTITVLNCPLRPKQRKSPENGDWKLVALFGNALSKFIGNKESLLKMEIERRGDERMSRDVLVRRNKESLLKMEIERKTLL